MHTYVYDQIIGVIELELAIWHTTIYQARKHQNRRKLNRLDNKFLAVYQKRQLHKKVIFYE